MIFMADMFEFMKILKDVSTLAKERNEMLKDSQYAAFALSDEALEEEAMKTASEIFKKKTSIMFQDMYSDAFRKLREIKVR